jgi:hypothetical protein
MLQSLKQQSGLWKTVGTVLITGLLSAVASSTAVAQVDAAEIYCTIRETGSHLNCQWVGKDNRRSMTPEETAQFIDKSEVAAYISVRSRRGMERTFLVDADAIQFKKLNETKRTGSISEIAKAKLDLFSDIEKKAIKISDDLDAQNATMELVKYDSSIASDKYKRELRRMDQELVNVKANLEQKVATNKAYENSPSNVDPSATSGGGFFPEWSVYAGVGTSSYSAAFGSTSTGSPTDLNLIVRYAPNQTWFFEAETLQGMSTTFSDAGGVKGQSLSTATTVAQANYCFSGKYCLALEVDPATYVGYKTKVDVWNETFAGVSFAPLYSVGKWKMVPRVGYLSGTSASSISPTSKINVSSDARLYLTYLADYSLGGHHGISGKLYYFSTTATVTGTGSQNVSDTELALAVFYKYSF